MPRSQSTTAPAGGCAEETKNRPSRGPTLAGTCAAGVSIPGKLPGKGTRTAGQTPPAKRRCSVRQTSVLLLAAEWTPVGIALKFSPLFIQQPLQIIQQTSVMCADGFHQVRKRKCGRLARAEKLADGLAHRLFFQFFLRVPWRVAKRSAFGSAIQQLLFEQAVERGHYGGVSQLDVASVQYLANRGAFPHP